MRESQNDQTRREDLVQRIEPASTWVDVAVPEQQLRILRELAADAAQHLQVKSSPDRGIIALFTGASRTRKTMAAEVLARDLHRELYRIDLTRAVNKYIGENEKNLSWKPLLFSSTISAFLDDSRCLATLRCGIVRRLSWVFGTVLEERCGAAKVISNPMVQKE
jgi:hypothetical protein